MIEATDEMVYAYVASADHPEWLKQEEIRRGIAAVLALVERDQAGPCSMALSLMAVGGQSLGDLWCQLRHGHLGDHENGPTRWKALGDVR